MADSEEPAVLHADPNDTGVYEIESLCMNCHDEVGIAEGILSRMLTSAGNDSYPAHQDTILQGNPS